MADQKPGMISDLVKGALTTAISVIVTYYVTSGIKKDEYKKDGLDQEKHHVEALEKTNKLLSDYVSKYDNLHTKYIDLVNQRANVSGDGFTETQSENSFSGNQLNSVSQALISGNWSTPDGSYNWNFSNNRLTIKGVGNYADSYEAAGSYQTSAGQVSGKYHVSRFFYIEVSYNFRFEATLNTDGTILYGTMTDNSGNTNTLALYKQ